MRGGDGAGAGPATGLRRPASLFRSEPMYMVQMIVQADAASETVAELGEMGTAMFCDLNEGATVFQRSFVDQMKLCDEVDRSLRYLDGQVEHAVPPIRVAQRGSGGAEASEPLPIGPTGLRDTLAEEGVDLKQLTSSEAQLISNYNHLVGSRPHTWCTATPCTFRSVHR